MVTKDFYLKNGLLYFSSQDEEYKCFEFSGRASVYEAVQQYNHVYMICDNSYVMKIKSVDVTDNT